MLFQWIDSLFEWGLLIVSKWFGRLRFIIQQVLTVVIFCMVVLWLSMFMYGCFYYTYMPTVTHERNLNLHFRTDCDSFNSGQYCNFPSANVTLVRENQGELLMRGQTYVVSVDVELPESPVNQNHGMIMTVLQFYTRHGEVVRSSARSLMLRYKSVLYQVLETIFYLPSLLMSTSEQKQVVTVNYFTSYQEDPYKPAIGVFFQLQSKWVEVYKVSLKIHATFYGLRYFLFHWPTLSAVIGISVNAFFISLVLLIAWCNLGTFEGSTLDQNSRKQKLREDLIREKASRNNQSLPVQFQSTSSSSRSRRSLNSSKSAEVLHPQGTQSDSLLVPSPSSSLTNTGDNLSAQSPTDHHTDTGKPENPSGASESTDLRKRILSKS